MHLRSFVDDISSGSGLLMLETGTPRPVRGTLTALAPIRCALFFMAFSDLLGKAVMNALALDL